MTGTILAAVAGLIGVLLGGGLRALENKWATRREAEAVLSALCAEVEALTRLANHRQYLAGFLQVREQNAALVAAGQGDRPCAWLTINPQQSYFATYEALNAKVGLLDPYYADRIVRFYAYAKSVLENYTPASPFQHTNAAEALAGIDNDILLMETLLALGNHISTFRAISPPPGVIDPFVAPQVAAQAPASEPSLPKDGSAGVG